MAPACQNMAVSCREKQIGALKQMLNLNASVSLKQNGEPVWKILVYDRCGQDIISPLVSVKELREMGITLHLLLDSDRDPVPDVPAIYFILPTEDNIQRLSQDFQNGLYDSYYMNFVSPISRLKLENIASAALTAKCVNNVHKVFDQYLNFISLEDNLFILRHQKSDLLSYYAYNRGEIKDTEMDSIMDTIVDSLFSVFVTLGTVPIIRSPRGNAAEMVAEKLDKKLRENLRDARTGLFTSDAIQAGQFSFQRPLLVILDRNQDLATPLHHSWTYQALAHDALNLSLNRVTMEEMAENSSRAKKNTNTYYLNNHDKFWTEHKGSPFPMVAEAVQEELDKYRASEGEVKRLKSAMGLDGESDEAISMISDSTAKLTSAVSSLPELLEKKRLIDMHTTIATGILGHIKARKFDEFFEVEEKVMSKAMLDRSVMDLIGNPEAGNPGDKMRLFLITLLCCQNMMDSEIDQYSSVLEEANCDLSAINYVKRYKTYMKLPISPVQYGGGGTKTVSMFSKLMSQGSSFVMEGVKNLVVKRHNLPVTRIVDALMELKNTQEVEDYRYFDPKLLKTSGGEPPKNRAPFQDAIVFMVGGGNYIEYQNLMDYAKSKAAATPKRVLYGCSNLMTGEQFLQQLSQLGQEIQ